MVEAKACCYLFLLVFLEFTREIQPSLHGHNNAFVQGDNDVQYLLDNIPISMHKGFASSVDGTGDSTLDDSIQDIISHIHFEPNILDFKERQLGVPHQETVTLYNRDDNRTIHLSSISGNTQHFHSSFFQDKVIPPLGNTTFNVVFLGREEGDIDSYLFIHTSDGMLKYQVRGVSVSSPYRLRPVVGVKLPLNASFTPLLYMHNPHSEAMQVVEVYSSGGEFQLELPAGQAEGPRELWEIPPYQTKPVIRLRFNAYTEKNHTAYVRFKVNNSAEVLVVAVEVEVGNGAGFHWGGSSGVVNLGMGGSLQPPIRYPIALKNSAKKPVKILNIISTPVSRALRINFEPVVIPGDTETPVTVGMLVYDWKTGLDLQHFKGKLLIKGIGPGGSSQKLAIPWVAEVLQGGLEVNTSVAHYCAPHSTQPRNFSVVNKFKVPLAITNVSLSPEARSLFAIKDFVPKVLEPGQRANIFSLLMIRDKRNDHLKLESSILVHSNVSTTEVPLLSYDGKVRKIIPGERESDKGTMNFGTVGSGTENEAIFALENQNPINIELHGWGVNMPGAVLELMGCQNGPTDLFNKGHRNITVCSQIGNQNIKPGYLAIFKIKVKTPMVEEDTIVGDVFVRTTYERLTVPVYMRVAHGRISLKKLTFTDCFPGAICMQQVKVHSTFARPMEVTFIAPVNKDNRVKYIPLEETTLPVISKGDNNVGSIAIDPSVTCRQHCYLGLSLNTSVGNQWLNTFSLPSHTRDTDLNLLNTRYARYLNLTGGGSWDNITMRLDTTEVRGHKFQVNIKPHWPSLLGSLGNAKNKSLLTFPLTQVGNTSFKTITLHNPSSSPVLVQLVLDWNYPQGLRLYHSLPNKFKPLCLECPAAIPGEFKLEENVEEREWFEKYGDVSVPRQSFSLYLSPSRSKTIRISYTPSSASPSSALLYVRNNITILEVLRLVGRGAHAQFKFGNRKPGSPTPLLFELTERHLKDCERMYIDKVEYGTARQMIDSMTMKFIKGERSRKNPAPNLTVKRSFTARNTGELPIDIHGFYISGLHCEGYGFKVLNCATFKLNPNATRKIEIAFTPDFTLSRVERELLILTSLGSDGTEIEGVSENGIARLTLLTTVPAHSLESCSAVVMRPTWERGVQWTAISLSAILLMCILAVSFLEADRILRGALASLSRNSVVQPPLDLRVLSLANQSTQVTNLSKDKVSCEEKNKANKKDETGPDWTLLSVRKNKEKDSQRALKIPDWTAEEERKFRNEVESKETSPFQRNEDTTIFDAGSNSNNVVSSVGPKKKNGRKQNSAQESSETVGAADNVSFGEVAQEKKYSVQCTTKSSPTANRKGKTSNIVIVKEEPKLVDQEIQIDASTGISNTARDNKSDGKRRHAIGNSNGHGNHVPYKKYEPSNNQKIVQFSEEETSSTTTESSVHDEMASYKDCEHNYVKSDKIQRKPTVKKVKPQSIPPVPSIDYRDNYEGDCDDDDYDKERHDNPNRWKTSTTRSSTKHHHHSSRCNLELPYKLPRQSKNTPRKEKAPQKRRTADKNHSKSTTASGSLTQREENRPAQPTISPPLPPPPPPSCWGENRAKFSDVVARNQESTSPFSITNKLHKAPAISHELSLPFNGTNITEYDKGQAVQDVVQTKAEFKIKPKPTFACSQELEMEKPPHQDVFMQTGSQLSNSYFINSFTEPPFELELVPYDDLPETDEPLVELESMEDDTRSPLWNDDSPMINLLPENTQAFSVDSAKPAEKVANLSDTLKDNWVTIETNWEPLYTRGAVGEERSGVWGVNTGGVWAAAPWGAPTPPLSILQPSLSLPQSEQDVQERSGFDPFRSLTTIWTPSSTDSWKSKQQE